MPSEVREIPSCPGYSATADGTVIGKTGRPLSVWMGTGGYWQVALYVDGAQRTKQVNRLVCEAFHGPPPDWSRNYHAAHWDGNELNNRPENLRWATSKENIEDKNRHGTMARGERGGRTKLTEAQVLEIRRRRASGELGKTLAEEFGVSTTVISRIHLRRIWAHI